MIFKNLKSGNLVCAKNAATIKLMQRSPCYEAYTAAPAAASAPARKKREPKNTTTKQGE